MRIKRKKAAHRCILAGLLLILLSVGFLIRNLRLDGKAASGAEELLLEYKKRTDLKTGSEEDDKECALHAEDALLFESNPNVEMKVGEVNGVPCVGVLSIPKLGKELVVLKELTPEHMKISPCCYVGTPYLDRFIIAGHNYDAFFGDLHTLKSGDSIYFEDLLGNVFSYQVERTEVLAPNEVEEMCIEGVDLTLFTCTVGGAFRIAVRCKKSGPPV